MSRPVDSAVNRDAHRAAQIATLPTWYSPRLHLFGPSCVAGAIIVACVALLHEPTLLDWLSLPTLLILANAAEWRLHKEVLHKRTRWLPFAYDRHTPIHHLAYIEEDMAMRDRREYSIILFPGWAIFALQVVMAPFALAMGWLLSANAALLFVAAGTTYMITYEWLHLSYHLPKEHWAQRLRLVQFLSRHHAAHHALRDMQHGNFNVNLPLWDYVRGTVLPRGERERAVVVGADAQPETKRRAG